MTQRQVQGNQIDQSTLDVDLILPSQTGNSGKVLGTDGTNSSWVSAAGSGTVTSVGVSSSGTITVGSSPITTSGTITVDLANTAVTPGSYTSADLTVDAQGRITAVSNGSGGGTPGGSNTQIQFNNSGVFGGSSSLTWDGSQVSITGNLNISGSGKKITGDFTNTTASNRVLIQSSTTNGATLVSALPNGTGVYSLLQANGVSDADNSGYIYMGSFSTANENWIKVGKTGTGTIYPLVIKAGSAGVTSFTVDAAARPNVVVGSAALATTDTDGFLYIPGQAGTPTGTPTSYTGRIPLTVDSSNSILYFYSGGSWKTAGGLADNPVLPGTGSVTLPSGTTAQRTTATTALARYNTSDNVTEFSASYPAGSFSTWNGLQRSIIHRKHLWLTDDFVGNFPSNTGTSLGSQLGWTFTSTGTSANFQGVAVTDHPGIIALRSGASTNNKAMMMLGSATTVSTIMANQVEYFAFLVNFGYLGINTIVSTSSKFGLLEDISDVTQGTAGANGVWFEFFPSTSSSLRFYTRSGSTSATPTSTVTVSADTWYLCEAFYDGTTWTPRVNGTNYTGISSNVPTTAVNVGAYVQTLTTANKTMAIDYFALSSTEMGNRY